jgi:hypothetical protein
MPRVRLSSLATFLLRRELVVVALAVLPALVGSAAHAQELPDEAEVSDDLLAGAVRADDSLSASASYQAVGQEGRGGGNTPGLARPSRPRTCEVHAAPGGPDGGGSENDTLVSVAGALVEDDWYYQTCRYTDTGELSYSGYWQYAPGDPVNPGPDLAALARQAFDEVPLTFPVPVTSPAIDIEQITGLPTWLWIDPGGWAELSAQAEVAGFWVEVAATPQRVTWDMGDGHEVTCDGPGTPYDPTVPDGDQSTDCSHVYQYVSTDQPGGQYTASVTVVWSVDWEASTGATGVLADASRTTTFGLTVGERQAVVTYDP